MSGGRITALDNTWGAGLAFNVFDYVDITVLALIKYPSGTANLLTGSVVTKSDVLFQKIRLSHMHLGWGVGANDVEQVLIGLQTIHLRCAAQDHVARGLASYLQKQNAVAQVLHPALEGAIGHAEWKCLCSDKAAGIFSVVFKPEFTQAQIDRFCEALKLFKLGYSWAGPISLVVSYNLRAMRQEWPAAVTRGCVVRFSIGLEDRADLQADIAQALQSLSAI